MTVTVAIHRMRLFCHHGVAEQERRVGNEFEVSAEMRYDPDYAGIRSLEADSLEATVDYSEAMRIIRREMDVPSKLIEHAALRISRGLCSRWPAIRSGRVTVTKLTPPCGAEVAGCSATVEW